MSASKVFSLFSAVATLTVAGAAASAEPSRPTCFSDFKPTRVMAYEVERIGDYRTHAVSHVLAGASVFIPAQPALTAEWLHHQLDANRAHGADASDCPLDVRGANMSVRSGGPGFWVTISTPNRRSAEEVLRRATRAVSGK